MKRMLLMPSKPTTTTVVSNCNCLDEYLDKAPGPDGFTGAFFKSCWEITKGDIMAAASAMYDLRTRNLQLINSANIVLIPKKDGTDTIGDFRPISLIHSFIKIITKTLALRLATRMNEIVSAYQSAFIKRRSIHDNFMAVRSAIRRYHRNKTPALFLKLDIVKAFDSVRWEYLLVLLERIGFPHGRGLRQGDPLSPFLFIFAIDPLHRLLEAATELGALSKLRGRSSSLRISLYADDAAIFIAPKREEIVTLKRLLELFGQASGLTTNFYKSTVIPIRCNRINLQSVLEGFPARRAAFPIKYLGLPLTNTRLCKMDFQFLVDKILAKLNSWNGRNLTIAGRLTLVKSVITPQTVYLLTALKAPAEVLELIDSKRRQFLWSGMERLTGGKCKVNWIRSARPKALGGLGILNLVSFARALCLRWLWQAWVRQDRPGPDGDGPCTETDKLFFAAVTSVQVGDGKIAPFWHVFHISKRKNRTLHQALNNNTWIRDLNIQHASFSVTHLMEFCNLWVEVNQLRLQPGVPDSIVWNFSSNNQYSARSAYQAHFLGSMRTDFEWIFWKAWAPPKCKFFSWLAIQDMVWTSDRLARRGWPYSPVCVLCRLTQESEMHLFFECRFSKRIWAEVAQWAAVQHLVPSTWGHYDSVLQGWSSLSEAPVDSRLRLRSLIILVVWELWCERNARIFENRGSTIQQVLAKIKGEAASWMAAGAKHLSDLLCRSVSS
ncbi:hypothetical protein U9M48_034892 [Paspalum notatum var. saurae]|uniref:Reverse transcriptase domain-containing protein n=1 Tax=Paspalum notatum var. saurae TaxID=547442 RepID=A0AAQ3X9F2_PASNO